MEIFTHGFSNIEVLAQGKVDVHEKSILETSNEVYMKNITNQVLILRKVSGQSAQLL